MEDKLDSILLQFIAEYHQGLNELAGHGSATEQAKEQILQAFMESLPEDKVTVVKIKTSEGEALVKGNYSRDKLCEMVGYNQALADVRKVIKEEL
jgi:hypothetical protein